MTETGSPFAVFDIDGTLIRWQLYHAIADQLVKLGYAEPGAYDSVKTARMSWKRRSAGASFKTYELELIKVYEQVLAGLTTEQFETAAQDVFGEYKDQVYTYTRELIKKLKKNGYLLLAISGSQLEIVKLIADHYGFDDYAGTIYERAGGGFSGAKVFAAHDKNKALKDMVKKHGLSFKGSIAVGDSPSDIGMLELVETPIAFNPDKDLFDHAQKQGWKIVLERKNMIYELERTDGKYQLAETN